MMPAINQQQMLTYKRGKRKVIADYKIDDIYRFYCESSPDNYVSKQMMHTLFKEMFPSIVKMIVLDNFQFRMPANLGDLRIKKKITKPSINDKGELDTHRLSIDWKTTKALWLQKYPDKTAEEIKSIEDKPVIRELNEHTDGYRYVWYWDKLTTNIPNQSAYYLDMTRTNDQILSGASKTNDLNFYK